MTIGPDIREAIIEVGSAITILRSAGNVTGEYLKYKLNAQVTKPFIQEFFLEADIPYDTGIVVGDVVQINVTTTRYLVMNLIAEMFENEVIKYAGVFYKCNVLVDLKRPTEDDWDDTQTYHRQTTWTTYGGAINALITTPLYGHDLVTDEELGMLGLERHEMYIATSEGVEQLDRVRLSAHEYYRVETVKKRRYSAVDVLEIGEDTRSATTTTTTSSTTTTTTTTTSTTTSSTSSTSSTASTTSSTSSTASTTSSTSSTTTTTSSSTTTTTSPPPPTFRFEVKTAGADTFQLPLKASGTYDFNVDWGDGSDSDITAYNDAAANHSYSGAGTFDVVITGTITGWRFLNGGDKTLIYDISEWGPLNLGNNKGYFYGCTNLTVSATDPLDLTGTTDFEHAFRNCSSLTTLDVSSWDVSSVTDFGIAFYGCSSLTTLDVSSWDVSSVTDFNHAFYGCSSLTTSGADNWDISSVTDMTNMFSGVTLTTVSYDAILIAWEAQVEQPNVIFHGGNSKYTDPGAAKDARDALEANGWTITDGGQA